MLRLNRLITILAIDTSCDETAVAVTRGVEVLANSLYSQLDTHKNYGGVVPGLAKLEHERKFGSVLDEALTASGLELSDIDAVAVTQGPGLAIALEVGIDKAKALATELNVPLIGVNHMAGHLLSALAQHTKSDELAVELPALGLLVSGGHTEFVEVQRINHYRKLGGTLDDACGEAYDKCARMLGLPYPGGPLISQLAEKYRAKLDIKFEKDQRTLLARAYKDGVLAYELPVPMAFTGDLNMSFSGLKTAVKKIINRLSNGSIDLNIIETAHESHLPEDTIGEIAAIFEAAAIKMLCVKLEQAVAAVSVDSQDVQSVKYREVWLGGGVVASDYFRQEVVKVCEKYEIKLRMPENKKLMTDNAAMIGVAAGLKVNELFDENGVEKLAELNSDVQLENGIYMTPQEFQLLDRNPILSL